jgi:[glutamine synthetase] adenylyltransferase / [glutamine synthetase]-adenylyl-L-tyrosine phosphorylase
VQYLVLLHASEIAELVRWTDNVRLIGTLNKHRLLDNDAANTLRGAYLDYRSRVHRLNLMEKDAVVPVAALDGLQDKVRAIWDRFLA